jgi:hypothetical protein
MMRLRCPRTEKDLAVAAPVAPAPSDAEHPAPRLVWSTPDGRLGLLAHDWADGAPATYGVFARTRGGWVAASGEQVWHLLHALAAHLDADAQAAD